MEFNAKYKDLSGKVVIVAGANGLLGKECVKGFINQDSIMIGIDFNESKNIKNDTYNHIICDLTNFDEPKKIILSLTESFLFMCVVHFQNFYKFICDFFA